MKTMSIIQKQRMVNPIMIAANRLGFLDAYSLLIGYCRSQMTILVYHRVGPNKNAWLPEPINTSDFEEQIRYLSKTHEILPLNKLAQHIREKKPLAKKVAVVTFDDGYKDNYVYAFPILKKYNVTATVFLITGHLDTGNLFWFDKIKYLLWNTKLKRLELADFGDISLKSMNNRLQSISKIGKEFIKIPDEKKNHLIEKLMKMSEVDIPHDLGRDVILSWEEVKEMNESGIDFGAHTVTHPILTRVSSKRARYEIVQSKKAIEKRLSKPANTFCYPNGNHDDFNAEIIDLVKESGFVCAVTTIPRTSTSKINLYSLGRTAPWSYDSFKFFVSELYSDANNAFSWIRRTHVY